MGTRALKTFLVLAILGLLGASALYQLQKHMLYRRMNSDYVHALLKSQGQPVRRRSHVGPFGYIFLFDPEGPFRARMQLIFNTTGRIRSLTVRVHAFDPFLVEKVGEEEELQTFPLAELEAAAKQALGASVAFETLLVQRYTFMSLRGRTLPWGKPFEADFERRNYQWELADWRDPASPAPAGP